ncbi:putative MFS family arabinose efflux permease [Rhizobium mesoamericanum]|nr:putative MFS family arabinose efflux permease [Rhizobium mesoamericanum]
MVYGIAIAIGNVTSGRFANRNPVGTLTGLPIAQAIVLVLLSFTAASPWLVVPTLAGLGFPSFANVPGLQIYVVHPAKQVRPAAVDVASALNIAAFHLGIAVGA